MVATAEAPTRPPEVNEGLARNFDLVHGTVEVPGASRPVAYTTAIPEVPTSQSLHVIIPGFGGVKRSSRGLRDALAGQHGRATISYEPSRRGDPIRDLLDAQRLHTDTITAILEDVPGNLELQAAPGSEILDLTRAILLPHSMGGLAATERAKRYPEQTDAVIYMGAVGLEPAKVMFDFVNRLVASAGGETAGKFAAGKLVPGASRLGLAYRVSHYYLSNLGRTAGEIATCFAADSRRKIHLVNELGVQTAALYFGRDRMVPPTPAVIELADKLLSTHRVMDELGHLAPQRQPQEVAAKIVEIIDHLATARP